jgi:hypothetical protein
MHEPYTGNDQVHVANGSGMDINRIGKTIIPTSDRDLVLNHVLHVPSTHKNLISVHRFTLDNDTFIEFHPYFFFIKDRKTKKVLLHGPCRGGLYPLPPSTSKFWKLVFSAIKISSHRWHSRLGHPSRDIVRRVVSKNNLPCASFDSTNESVCDACACAKAYQLPYSVSTSRSSAPLELIFTDVWGPALDSFGRKNIMLALLMITASLPGFICCVINLRFLNIFLSFKNSLSVNLIEKFLLCSLTGEVNMKILIPFFAQSASLIKFHVLIPINKMELSNASIVTLLRWASLYLLMLPCLLNIGMKLFLV